MKKLLILSLILIFLPITSFAQDEIMEKLNKIEQDISVLKEGQNYTNKRIDDLDNKLSIRINDLDNKLGTRIDDLDNNLSRRMNDLLGFFYVLLAGMFTLVGFILWDRRTTLAPAVKQMEELKQKEKTVDKLLEALNIYARKEPRFKEAMQTAGLL